tara:strand:+ start:734 stop:1057 length:324 start_codon:yes stop_codon:yes gene_type:complete
MIRVSIGNLKDTSDNSINIDGEAILKVNIPKISKTIWAFEFNEETGTGEIEFQNNRENNNLQINNLAELETSIGCKLESIKKIHSDETARIKAELDSLLNDEDENDG